MATIDEAYNLLKYRATKSGFNGNISPNDFNLLWNRAEQRYFNEKYKLYLVNQRNSDSLLPFKTPPQTVTVDSNGKWTKPVPKEILHIDAITHTYNSTQVEVTRVENDRLGNNLSSSYDFPTAEFPIYVDYDLYVQFYPVTLGNANIVYLKKLVPAVWGYTLVNGRPQYSSGASVQPLWSDNDIDEIIYYCGVDLGLNLRDAMVLQVNDQKAKENI